MSFDSFVVYMDRLHRLALNLSYELECDDLPFHTREAITVFLAHYMRCQLELQSVSPITKEPS
jgi:hypothetical protein